MTLVEFLQRRIAQVETVAQAAMQTPGAAHWQWVDGETDEVIKVDPFVDVDLTLSLRSVEELHTYDWGGGGALPDFVIHTAESIWAPAALHMTIHDPAFVLADCAGKRLIVDDHDGVHECTGPNLVSDPEHEDGTYGGPCNTLRALALPFADHPEFQSEWAIQADI